MKIIKKLIPNKFKQKLIPHYHKYLFNRMYKNDMKKFKKYSYELSENFTYNNLRSKITFHYHSIEKGLSNANLRYNFGAKAFEELFFSMDLYIKKGYPTNDARFQQSISVIKNYVNLHLDNDKDVTEINNKLEQYLPYFNEVNNNLGGSSDLYLVNKPDFSKSNFLELLKFRHSIRDYGQEKIDEKEIVEAINMSIYTPSACNRQPWKAYYIKNKDKINDLIKLQGGLTTNGINIRGIIAVTSNYEYYNGPHERNQVFIDGGMFAMNLINSLTYKNIASCPLHADLFPKNEEIIRNILNIKESECFICFIALGSYPESYKIANSPREEFDINTLIVS